MKAAFALCLLMAPPAIADVQSVILREITPGYHAFATAASQLDMAARQDCTPENVRPAYDAAFDAWMRIAHVRIGPVEEDGRALAIAFWPDTKGAGQRVLNGLLTGDQPLDDPAGFAENSVAARGFFAMEKLLYDPEFTGDRSCALIRAVATDLSRMAGEIVDEWRAFATQLETAGQSGNTRFLSPAEATQAIYTQFLTGLEFNADTRVGRPLGTFDRPRPERAEARLSRRSLRNVQLSLAALEAYVICLKTDIPRTFAAIKRAEALADRITDPAFADIDSPAARLKLEILQQALHAVRDTAEAEVAPALGVSAGFNAADGD